MRAVEIRQAQISRLNTHPLLSMKVPCVAFRADNLDVYAYANREPMGLAASVRLEKEVEKIIKLKSSFCLINAAAPSQDDVLAELVASKTFPWEHIRASFMMDEYFGLSPRDHRTFRYYLSEHLWGPVISANLGLNPELIKQIRGETPEAEEEIKRYIRLLRQYLPDVVQGGVGEENAHIAFNDPPKADWLDPYFMKLINVALAAKKQQVAEGHFKSIKDVPPAFTLTVPTLIDDIDYWSCVVPTERKATAVEKMVLGPIIPEVPGSILRLGRIPRPNIDSPITRTALFLDLASAYLLEKPLFDNLGINFKALQTGPTRHSPKPAAKK